MIYIVSICSNAAGVTKHLQWKQRDDFCTFFIKALQNNNVKNLYTNLLLPPLIFKFRYTVKRSILQLLKMYLPPILLTSSNQEHRC